VRIAIAILGFGGQTRIEVADPTNLADTLRRQNPLGKIPVLIDEDDTAYYDSRVILEFLDERAGGGKIIPRQAPARLAALRLQALADGILDASILTVYEARWRAHEHHEQKWLDHQAGKVTRALAMLESNPPVLDAASANLPDVGQIALACALGYRDFRFGGSWRDDHPRLVAWLDDFAARVPAFAATAPTG
jgi:glutathione S-transferase